MEGYAVNGAAVRLEVMPCWGAWEPGRGILVFAGEGSWSRGVDFGLESGVAGFKVHDLFLESDDGGPFLFKEAFIFLARGFVERVAKF